MFVRRTIRYTLMFPIKFRHQLELNISFDILIEQKNMLIFLQNKRLFSIKRNIIAMNFRTLPTRFHTRESSITSSLDTRLISHPAVRCIIAEARPHYIIEPSSYLSTRSCIIFFFPSLLFSFLLQQNRSHNSPTRIFSSFIASKFFSSRVPISLLLPRTFDTGQ